MRGLLVSLLLFFAATVSAYAIPCPSVFLVCDADQVRHDYLDNEREQPKQAKATRDSGTIIRNFDYEMTPTGLRKKITESGYIGARTVEFRYDTDLNGAAKKARVYRLTEEQVDTQNPTTYCYRIYIEYDRSASGRGPGHSERIRSNDPDGAVFLFVRD
jgi:hypothetical protein